MPWLLDRSQTRGAGGGGCALHYAPANRSTMPGKGVGDMQEAHSLSLYDVLGIQPNARPADIRAAYLRLARLHHPDRWGGGCEDAKQRFQRIVEAYTGGSAAGGNTGCHCAWQPCSPRWRQAGALLAGVALVSGIRLGPWRTSPCPLPLACSVLQCL